MQNEHSPRPRWNHKMVKEAVAAQYVDDVREWAVLMGIGEEAERREFLALLTVALVESVDAYQAGRYLEDFYDWPVTGDLIRILDRAYSQMRTATKKFVIEWVVKNNVRFPGRKNDVVRCRVGDVRFNGTVVDVIVSEARAVVRLGKNQRLIDVCAEEVLEVLGPAKPVPSDPPKRA